MEEIDSYLDTHFNGFKSYSDVKKELLKFCEIVKKENLDYIISLMENNAKINSYLDVFCNSNLEIIKNGDLVNYFDNNILLQIVNIYCDIHNINIRMSDEVVSKEDIWDEDSTTMYLNEINSIPLLSAEEEKALFIKYKQGNVEARKKIVNSNLRLVAFLAKKKLNRGIELLDLIQEGSIGLMIAVDKFDCEKEYKFSTYATWWIRQHIDRAINNKADIIRVPIYVNDQISKLKVAYNTLSYSLDREPTEKELAKEMGMNINDLKKLNNTYLTCYNLRSLNENVYKEEFVELQTIIPSEYVLEEEVENKIMNADLYKLVFQAELTQRELDILLRKFGLEQYKEPQSLIQIAEAHSCSIEWVRVNINRAIQKIRNYDTIKNAKDAIHPRRSLYEIFNNYPKSEIDELISLLNSSDKYIIEKYNNNRSLSNTTSNRIQRHIIPIMGELLENEYYRQGKNIKSLFDWFGNYSRQDILDKVELLSTIEKTILAHRFGRKYDGIDAQEISIEEAKKFYCKLAPKMESLIYGNKYISNRRFKILISDQSSREVKEFWRRLPVEDLQIVNKYNNGEELSLVERNRYYNHILKNYKAIINDHPEDKFPNKINVGANNSKPFDYDSVLSILNNEKFRTMQQVLSTNNAIILWLKYIGIDGNTYSDNEIARVFDLKTSDVIEIVKQSLKEYQNNIYSLIKKNEIDPEDVQRKLLKNSNNL